MKMRKLLSIGALTLAIATCTSIGASAAEVANGTEGNKTIQARKLVKNGLDGKKVVNKLPITANTKLGSYLTTDALEEINCQLNEAGIKVKVSADDDYYKVQKALVKAARELDETSKENVFNKLKKSINDKFDEVQKLTDAQLSAQANKYFKVSSYGKLTFATNMDNSRVVSLFDKNGSLALQVSGENIKAAKERVAGVNSLDELISLANEYYPGAEDYINSIK